MPETIYYRKSSPCCPGSSVSVKREVFSAQHADRPNNVVRSFRASDQAIVDFKALSYLIGNSRQISMKAGLIGSRGRIGQAIQGAASFLIPGDTSPLRSPLRSAAWSAITPGLPGGAGGIGRRNRAARCPEGYQYGGRFTDNRLSTCGAKLFDLPSPLGATIAAIRSASRGPRLRSDVDGKPLGAGEYTGNVVQSRAPQIPRVGASNAKGMKSRVNALIKDMGGTKGNASRMVRRDGFVLEPVVSAGVLRTIPDNRDMEGATYLTNLQSVAGLGGDELGLLSNTGVSSINWVLPGGSSISISKVRPLTVGERRKLGRTVNQAIKMNNSKDPLARLNYVAAETGDGIKVREDFVGISNPKQVVTSSNGKSSLKWVSEVFGKKKGKIKPQKEERESVSLGSGSKISDIDEALAHLNKGGSLLDVSPSILQDVLFRRNMAKIKDGKVSGPGDRSFLLRNSKKPYEHMHFAYASDVQQHLGLESLDSAFIGKGNKRRYLVESPDSVFKGLKADRNMTLDDASPADVATLMVSDVLTGIDNRTNASLVVYSSEDRKEIVAIDNPFPLIPLSDVKVTKRQASKIDEIRSITKEGIYGKYFADLKDEQKQIYRKQLSRLITRATKFDLAAFRERLTLDGELSTAEKTHIKIIAQIYEARLSMLKSSLDSVVAILGGKS